MSPPSFVFHSTRSAIALGNMTEVFVIAFLLPSFSSVNSTLLLRTEQIASREVLKASTTSLSSRSEELEFPTARKIERSCVRHSQHRVLACEGFQHSSRFASHRSLNSGHHFALRFRPGHRVRVIECTFRSLAYCASSRIPSIFGFTENGVLCALQAYIVRRSTRTHFVLNTKISGVSRMLSWISSVTAPDFADRGLASKSAASDSCSMSLARQNTTMRSTDRRTVLRLSQIAQ